MSACFIFHNKVLDADKLNNEYLPKAVASLGPYEPEILVVDENSEQIEGDSDHVRTVVVKFKSREDAKSWYNSAEYQAVLPLRLESTEGTAALVDEFVPSAA